MEYIFGVDGDKEILKTIGKEHTDFSGFLNVSREKGGVTIIDRCKIVALVRSDEDAEGNKYDWYEVSDHYRYEDRQGASSISDSALAELSQLIGMHDEAIAELSDLVSQIIEGGNSNG